MIPADVYVKGHMAGRNVHVLILGRRLVAGILAGIIISVWSIWTFRKSGWTFARVDAKKSKCNWSCNDGEGGRGERRCFNSRKVVNHTSTDDRVLSSTTDGLNFLCPVATISYGPHNQVFRWNWRWWRWSGKKQLIGKSRCKCSCYNDSEGDGGSRWWWGWNCFK